MTGTISDTRTFFESLVSSKSKGVGARQISVSDTDGRRAQVTAFCFIQSEN